MDPSDNNRNGHVAGSFSLALKKQRKPPSYLFRFANLPEITNPAVPTNQNLPPAGSSNLSLPPAGPSNQNLPPEPTDGLGSKKKQSPPYSIQIGPEMFPLLVKLREEFEEKKQDEDTKITSWVLFEKSTPDKN